MIYNYTKNTIIAEEYKICRSFLAKLRGQMFRKEIKPMIFEFSHEQKTDLHSFFVKEAIDVIYVNESWEVVELVHEFMPKKLHKAREKARYILEMPAGTIAMTDTEIGDVIHIKQ